ncbi:metallophosphoesterase [Acidimangrovimonas sediminis]|uniref:metallophosphoesterase n=1 Tax=Acidimangrovimonas sediminis TaxID=2056283 RepID=UPI000C7F7C76|nr:metallophosphoesterase [Acidimangrovimonas sediminis]
MANWYSADLHFGHTRIIDFCGRPFGSTAEMNAAMIRNFRTCVGDDDELWILGDFAFGKDAAQLSSWFHQLLGRKHLITGNHDDEAVISLPWACVADLTEIRDGDQALVLSHYPIITWNGARRGALQLFGHVHDRWKGSRNSINVGVDQWDFRPVQISDIARRARKLPINKHWKDVEQGSELD